MNIMNLPPEQLAAIEALSDALYSTFTVIRTSPLILANMCSAGELEAWKKAICEHMKWDSCDAVATGQLAADYDIHYFSETPHNRPEEKPRTKETIPSLGY